MHNVINLPHVVIQLKEEKMDSALFSSYSFYTNFSPYNIFASSFKTDKSSRTKTNFKKRGFIHELSDRRVSGSNRVVTERISNNNYFLKSLTTECTENRLEAQSVHELNWSSTFQGLSYGKVNKKSFNF